MVSNFPQLRIELEHRIREKTGRRVRNLGIEVSQGRVVLRGEVTSYYDKQLAQHGVREILPEVVRLENEIRVCQSALV